MAYVSSPAFDEDQWVWMCGAAADRRANSHRTESRLIRLANRTQNQDTPGAAAAQETGAPPLEAELPDQAGFSEGGGTGPVPGAAPWPGLHCIGHPSIPNLVCCSKSGLYGKHDYYCVTVPQ